MSIVFHTDYSVTRRGFRAAWTRIPGLAGGNIVSPNHPASYPNRYNEVIEKCEVDLQFWQLSPFFLIREALLCPITFITYISKHIICISIGMESGSFTWIYTVGL